MTKKFLMTMPEALYEDMEAARGDVARNLWVRRLIERELGIVPVGTVPPTHMLAGAVRGSSSAKADVRPIPKGTKGKK